MRTRHILQSIDSHIAESKEFMRESKELMRESNELMSENREALDRSREAYEDQREFMREVLLRIDRTISDNSKFLHSLAADLRGESDRTRELMRQTSRELTQGMRETREDDKAVRAALFVLIDEIRGWRQGPGPAPA